MPRKFIFMPRKFIFMPRKKLPGVEIKLEWLEFSWQFGLLTVGGYILSFREIRVLLKMRNNVTEVITPLESLTFLKSILNTLPESAKAIIRTWNAMLLPFQGANPNIHRPRAMPWAGCLVAIQAATSQNKITEHHYF